MRDVIIIGAGISGCTIARELSRFKLDIIVVEAGYDVGCGASRTNSGIVHGGFDPEPLTCKAELNAHGMRLIPELARQLGFRYINNGSLVVAFSEKDIDALKVLLHRAKLNGIKGCRIIDADELRDLEPAVSPEAVGALLCECSGIVDPFGMTCAFAENAAINGVEFSFNRAVVSLKRANQIWTVGLSDGTQITSRFVINAAGASAIDLHNMVMPDNQLESRPRSGEYVLLSRDMGPTFTHTMFQVPGPAGKGVLISPTVEGNLIVGPDAVDVDDPHDTATTQPGLEWVIEQAQRTWPDLNRREIITNFAGVRPSGADGDFYIGESPEAWGFYDIAAFDSPGLTSAPAMALRVGAWLAARIDLELREDFVATREQPPRFIEMDDEARQAAIEGDPAFGHLVCRCEQVSEAEIVATLHGPIPVTTVTGVKRRCRAGTGRCQGGFCEPLVAQIISRECGIPLSEVCLAGPGSQVAPHVVGSNDD